MKVNHPNVRKLNVWLIFLGKSGKLVDGTFSKTNVS